MITAVIAQLLRLPATLPVSIQPLDTLQQIMPNTPPESGLRITLALLKKSREPTFNPMKTYRPSL